MNWAPRESKRLRAERYSPAGTDGLYFGWTLEAAENEARYYGDGTIDPNKFMILVIECCFDNILYLTGGCMDAVWEILGLEIPTSLIDMYLTIMDPRTDNSATNAIGTWARKEGFSGIVYPTARYDQIVRLQKAKLQGLTIVPAMNFVEMGTHLCDNHAAMMHSAHAVLNAINDAGGLDRCMPVFADPNLVLFDHGQISGERWGVVYQTFPLDARKAVLAEDDPRRQAKSYTYWASDEKPRWAET